MWLKFLRDVTGCYGIKFRKGQVIKHRQWDHTHQGLSMADRESKGIFVECHGHGEFDVFTKDDVQLLEDI